MMEFVSYYSSPVGDLVLKSDGENLTGLSFTEGTIGKGDNIEFFETVKRWLDIYFSGEEPNYDVPVSFCGTKFQNEVWEILCGIPYGNTMTYGDIAKKIEERHGGKRMSAQAVGGALGKNPIAIIIPCHRVLGRGGNLTGYNGGIDKKIKLLKLERIM